MSTTWILAASRARARLFEFDEAQRNLSEIEAYAHMEGRAPSGSRGDNRPSRSFDSKGAGRHAVEPHTEPVLKHAERFARRIAASLEDGRTHHRFDHLILVAPPQFLGHLRRCMPANLRDHVVREVGKDMTRSPADAIRDLASERFPEAR